MVKVKWNSQHVKTNLVAEPPHFEWVYVLQLDHQALILQISAISGSPITSRTVTESLAVLGK